MALSSQGWSSTRRLTGERELGPLPRRDDDAVGGAKPLHSLRRLTFEHHLLASPQYTPTFLMMTGYEQVRSVVAAIAGDMQAADDVRLVLPETGVCTNQYSQGEATTSSGCCGGPAPVPEAVRTLQSVRVPRSAPRAALGPGTEYYNGVPRTGYPITV